MASKTLGSLIVKLGFDPKTVDQGLKKFERDLKATGRRMESIGKAMSVGFTAPFLLGLGKAIQAYDEEAQVTRKLQIALGGTSKALLQQAADIQKVTTYADDQIITQQAYAAALGHSEDQIKDMTTAAVGLAAGMGIGLDEAMKNLHKSTTGVTGKVLALIPGIKDLTAEQLKHGDAIKIVNERFAGFAEAAALTGAGPLKALKNQFGDLMEQMGQAVLPIVVALSEKIKELISWFQNLDPEVKQSIVSWGLLIAAIGPMLVLIPKIIGLFGFLTSEAGAVVLSILAIPLAFEYVRRNLDALIDPWKLLWWGFKDHVVSNINEMLSAINGLMFAMGVATHTQMPSIGLLNKPKAPDTAGSNNKRGSSKNTYANPLQSPLEFLQSIGTDLFGAFGGKDGQAKIDAANAKLDELAKTMGGVGDQTTGAAKAASRFMDNLQGITSTLKPISGGKVPKITQTGSAPNPNTTSGSDWAFSPDGGFQIPTTGMDKMTNSVNVAAEAWSTMGDIVGTVIGQITSSLDEGGKSFGQYALEAIKATAQIVRAKLIELAVNAIGDSTKKAGLPGLFIGIAGATAGIAIIQKLLSGIQAPKLAKGGSTYGPTMALIGDNPSGKEMVHPWERNAEFAKSIAGYLGGGSRSGGGGSYEFVLRGDTLRAFMTQGNQNAQRKGNISFKFNGKSAGGGDG